MKKVLIPLALFIVVTGFATVYDYTKGGRPLSAVLLPENEVPPCTAQSGGSGTFEMTVNPGQGIITYELTAENIDPALFAHIHRGEAGVVGGVVVPLNAPTGGYSSGEYTVSKELAKEILKNPEEFYVNVHNAICPAGAIRGQLSKK
mgnify:CR=1 FL=1